jgi:hypothetical protein
MSAFDKQVGGNWYSLLAIQPMEYSLKNGLNAAQHTVIKYTTRYKWKGGREDLDKAIHCLEMLKEIEYPKGEGPAGDEHELARRTEIGRRIDRL